MAVVLVLWLLQPIVDGICNHVFAAEKVHAHDTPVAVLEPGLGCPGPDDCGSATTAPSPVRRRRRRSTFTVLTTAASTRQPISRTSRGFCKPMP